MGGSRIRAQALLRETAFAMFTLTMRRATAVIVAILAVIVHGAIPEDRAKSCGPLLSPVIATCSQPELSRQDWCCATLNEWNANKCWCEFNGFAALDAVSADGFSFSFRQDACKEMVLRPTVATIDEKHSTCPPYDSIGGGDDMEECPDVAPNELRTQRWASLDALRDDKIENEADLGRWFLSMDELFAEDASLEIVGLGRFDGRFEVKQYLVTRQQAFNMIPWNFPTKEHFWRSPRDVSYAGSVTTFTGDYTKREFVTFEDCTARIKSVTTSEDNMQQRYQQFWDPRETRLIMPYSLNANTWCGVVQERCKDDTFPFADMEDCETVYNKLKDAGAVTCQKFSQPYVPSFAMHGNTIACRSFYLDLALADPAGACPAVGETSTQPRCGDSQCPASSFIDPFARDASTPQYEESTSFTCDDTTCQENWPSDAQARSAPIVAAATGEPAEDVGIEDTSIEGAAAVTDEPAVLEDEPVQEVTMNDATAADAPAAASAVPAAEDALTATDRLIQGPM